MLSGAPQLKNNRSFKSHPTLPPPPSPQPPSNRFSPAMPPKSKAGPKSASAEPKAATDPPPETIAEQSKQRFYRTNPVEKRIDEVGHAGLTPAERKTYAHTQLILPVSKYEVTFSNKTEREFWKTVTKESLPIRRLPRDHDWGKDKTGRDIGTYKLDEFKQRQLKQAKLRALDLLHKGFLTKRRKQDQGGEEITQEDIDAEKKRRQDMAALKKDLYGDFTGLLAKDPLWDDVIPIPQNETEGALAQIAYPEDYAEAASYLRAVMAAEEHSPRCLRLTEHVISMNPAHYTVWLYRFQIITTLGLPITDEIAWLNEVALANLKNYQIWHHRQLLMDYHYPSLDPTEAKKLARSETEFVTRILEEDTKNYHVWSYRQYLVETMGLFTPSELGATQNMIEDDVRNNSAWSHRFFLVFSDPTQSTPDALPTAHDPEVPAEVIDRELNYAREKISLAPQNQSGWNYLRGVLAKGGRPLDSISDFAEQFVTGLGQDDEKVTSSYAVDYLADMYLAKGEKEKAELCLRRLAEKWDPVRAGYWQYRIQQLRG